ncbi:MAG: alpha/beta hydrolase [Parcubacteria group bacterium]|jgi:predicted alpha/beta hydrolase family esterase
MNKKIVIPGWMNYLKINNLGDNFEILKGKVNIDENAECIVGHSLGALITLRDFKHSWEKIILINPPLPKRSIIVWFFKWINYVVQEGLSVENQKFSVNPVVYFRELINCIRLLRIDFAPIIDNLPSDKVIVIRGENDYFFCDDKAVNFLRSKNIRIIEIANCGHNWCGKIEDAINKLT